MERVPFTVLPDHQLSPDSNEARAVLAKLNVGERIAVEIYRERNSKFSARVNFVFERIAQAEGMRVRNIRGWVAAMTGRADVVTINHRQAAVAWGTGPRDMNATEFEAFWMDAREVISSDILPALKQDDASAILNMLLAFDER